MEALELIEQKGTLEGQAFPMNRTNCAGLIHRWVHRLIRSTRWVGTRTVCRSFGSKTEQHQEVIERIYVINLDRQVHRWNRIQRELGMLYDWSNSPLINLTKRISAVDARYSGEPLTHTEVQPVYSLGDQLFVEPNPLLSIQYANDDQPVEMTRQEIAVALSHISAWKLIASSDKDFSLILEDDIFFSRNFALTMDKAWAALTSSKKEPDIFDVLYTSYEEAKTGVESVRESETLFKPIRGLWCLSGYILTRKGAKRLLQLLPVRGPVDVWINQQFGKLDVYATRTPIINQRRDIKSDNLYSILPVLSKIGVLTEEGPSIFTGKKLPKPVFVFGRLGSGFTSLSMALSMLGYRCCSDSHDLPKRELDDLLTKKRRRVFDAYVNVGCLFAYPTELARKYPKARFIITVANEEELIDLNRELLVEGERGGLCQSDHACNPTNIARLHHQLHQVTRNVLILSRSVKNKWAKLCEFLECDPPNGEFPECEDQRQRQLAIQVTTRRRIDNNSKLKFDRSPWVVPLRRDWCGLPFSNVGIDMSGDSKTITMFDNFRKLDRSTWVLQEDTFPSNLALFDPTNFSISNANGAKLTLIKKYSGVREYKSASIRSRNNYLYGRFAAVVKPAKASGLITGVFLHRNSPRQEIDIEFLGKDTTKILINVFYNPGGDGARFDFGYRGTPVLIDLGFDASLAFHQYEIDWSPTAIRWFVDGRLVYERANWDPTPIPHLPMHVFINLWPTRSEELAGKLSDDCIPACTEIKSVNLEAWPGRPPLAVGS